MGLSVNAPEGSELQRQNKHGQPSEKQFSN
jgi:hypothetical protein